MSPEVGIISENTHRQSLTFENEFPKTSQILENFHEIFIEFSGIYSQMFGSAHR